MFKSEPPPLQPVEEPDTAALSLPRIVELTSSSPAPALNGAHLTREEVPLYFVFRRNGIYENYISEIKSILESWERKVEMVALPPDIEASDITVALRKHSIPYDRCVLYTDRTVMQRLPAKLEFPGLSTSTIDDMFAGCGLKVICQELGIKFIAEVEVEDRPGRTFLESYIEAHEQRFKSVFERALKTKHPDMIIIDSRCMNEHVPFCVLSSKHPDRQAARLLRRWITELGFPATRIMVTHDVSALDPAGFAECKRLWFLGDRHWQDKAPGKLEIAHFLRSLTELQHSLLLDEAMEEARHQQELSELEDSANELGRMPWDGDDGIDLIDHIDLSDPDLDEDEVELPADDPELNDTIAALDRTMMNLSYLEVPQTLVSARYLAIPMDSLLESMVAQELLPVNHAEQGPRLVALAAENIDASFPALELRVLAARAKKS